MESNRESQRNYFSVHDPIDIIRKRQFNLVGKYAQMNPAHLPCQFLTAWVSQPPDALAGGQHYTLHNSYVDTLQHVLCPNVPNNGTIESSLPLVQNHEHWKQIETEWLKCQLALMIYM